MLGIDKNQLDSDAGLVPGNLHFTLCMRLEVKAVIGPQGEYRLEGIFPEVPGMQIPKVCQSMSNKADWA